MWPFKICQIMPLCSKLPLVSHVIPDEAKDPAIVCHITTQGVVCRPAASAESQVYILPRASSEMSIKVWETTLTPSPICFNTFFWLILLGHKVPYSPPTLPPAAETLHSLLILPRIFLPRHLCGSPFHLFQLFPNVTISVSHSLTILC